MKTYIRFILSLLLPLTVGAVAGIATASSVNGWYAMLHKPSFNPPNFIFGPVWTTLYILMGISLFIVSGDREHAGRRRAFLIFGIQLTLNFLWSFLFFTFHSPGLAFAEIVLLWVSILVMIVVFYRIRPLAGLLQIPYLLWVSFASVLNASVFFLN